jgi:hypothetical protein
MTWYRFLYWRLLTWHERWKGPGAQSTLWALVWLWILHVLNLTALVFALLRSFPEKRASLGPWFVEHEAWIVAGVLAVGVLWGWALLRRRTAIREEFSHLERRPFPARGDVAVIVYVAVTLLSFAIIYGVALAETIARR